MNPQQLSKFLSTLISQLLIILIILINSSESNSNSNEFNQTFFPLLHQFNSSFQIATNSLILSRKPKAESRNRKRKRTLLAESEPDLTRNPDPYNITYKMSSSTFEWLSGLLEPLLECRDPAGSPINLAVGTRLGIGLFRLSTGSNYPEVSTRFGVSELVARFCVKQLCRVLCTNYRFWVGFPSQPEIESISAEFEELTGLPNCCGAIACTKFAFSTTRRQKLAADQKGPKNSNFPGKNDVFSAQIVVDSRSRILSIFAGVRGSRSDFEILKSSTLYKDIENKELLNSSHVSIHGVDVNQYMVGDGEYPLLPWLITPFHDPNPNSCEEDFNNAHHTMRVSSRRTITSLKQWGALNGRILEDFKTAVAYISACAILHNVLIMRDDVSSLFDDLGDDFSGCDHVKNVRCEDVDTGFVIRNALARKARENLHSSML